jgi:stress response protein YsnF
VVDKQARVVEEVALRKQSDTHTDTVSDTVRRTDVEVDREDDETTSRR